MPGRAVVNLLELVPLSKKPCAFACRKPFDTLRSAHSKRTDLHTEVRRNIHCRGFLDELTDFINGVCRALALMSRLGCQLSLCDAVHVSWTKAQKVVW